MSRFQSAFDEARELYHQKSRFHDAAVLFAQARQVAREERLTAEAAKAGVWAVESWRLVGRYQRAFALLTDLLRSEEHALAPNERWIAQTQLFDITFDYFPDRAKLEQRLAALTQLQQEYPSYPLADLHQLRGHLLAAQGVWGDALSAYELAWATYDGNGYVKWGKAARAATCNLHMGNLAAAQRWVAQLATTETERTSSRVAWERLRSELALYQGDYAAAAHYAEQAEQRAAMIQAGAGGPEELRVRTLLLQAEWGDPAAPHHPARTRLGQRFTAPPNVYAVDDRALLVADYRLAAVRFLLALPPVDDLWYQQTQTLPQRLPSAFALPAFVQRVARTERALARAMQRASALDACFACDWRQAQVQQRSERLAALVAAVQELLLRRQHGS